jgi:NTE family protein
MAIAVPARLTEHAARTYLAAPEREGIALCLSGGGFRAALFHLGAVRRLYELGLLDQVRTISATSGGTMLAAFLAHRWRLWFGQDLDWDGWERLIAMPFRRIASRNINTIPVLVGWLPWNWMNNAGIDAMADACEARGVTRQTTSDLPAQPEFVFKAADLVSGDEFLFARTSAPAYRVATAVAVASCYPGFFRPFTVRRPQRLALVDGGVHDDRAVEPVWRSHARLLVSDGGDVLRPQWGESILWSLFRSAAVLWNQSQVVQKRWLISNFIAGQLQGAYWSVEGSPLHYGDPGSDLVGYSPELARDVIASIRTDYDAFSDAEAAVLENHGYLMVDAAARRHLEELPQRSRPLRVPHPAWMSEPAVRRALRGSARKRFFGRW